MSAPSRRPEIRRRRTRNEKIVKLRKRHAAASTEAERTRIAGKLLVGQPVAGVSLFLEQPMLDESSVMRPA